MFFVLMSNKTLLHVQQFWTSKSWADQILYTVQSYKQFVTASTSTLPTLVFLFTLPWRYDTEMSIVNSLHASA